MNSKLKKTGKVALIIFIPTILVLIFFLGTWLYKKYKFAELKKTMQLKYSEIKSVDDFLEAVKYLDETTQFGYDFTKLYNKKVELDKMPFDKLQRLYELAKKGSVGLNANSRTIAEDEEFMNLINVTRRQYLVYP